LEALKLDGQQFEKDFADRLSILKIKFYQKIFPFTISVHNILYFLIIFKNEFLKGESIASNS
jgi:hypothetical protein